MNPFELNESQLKTLRNMQPAIEAIKELRDRRSRGRLTHERLYMLIFRATGDEDLADKGAADFLLSQIRAGEVRE